MALTQGGAEADAADDPARGQRPHRDARRLVGRPAQGRAEAEPDQHGAGVRRELEARPDLGEAGAALDQRDRVARPGQGERRGEATDSCADDDDGERRHGVACGAGPGAPDRQAAFVSGVSSCQTHSAGVAVPGFSIRS